jgi:hypothetical protein
MDRIPIAWHVRIGTSTTTGSPRVTAAPQRLGPLPGDASAAAIWSMSGSDRTRRIGSRRAWLTSAIPSSYLIDREALGGGDGQVRGVSAAVSGQDA